MAKFKPSYREPRDPSWYNFPSNVLSMASRLRVQWGRPETPGTWRRIAAYLHRSGFPAYDVEKLRLAVADFDDRLKVLGDTPRPRRTYPRPQETQVPPVPRQPAAAPAAVPSVPNPPPPEPVRAKTREELDASWATAWAAEFPGEPFPGEEQAILLIAKKARQERRRRV